MREVPINELHVGENVVLLLSNGDSVAGVIERTWHKSVQIERVRYHEHQIVAAYPKPAA